LETISDSTDTLTFTYDGDGKRVVQENPDGTTTLFLGGGSYEVHLSAGGQETLVRRYYGVAGQRVLLDGTDTRYLLTDHLGSVVAVADSSGDLVSEQRYLPYGEGRFTPGITQTDFGFTGQRNLAAVGLMDYHARWYATSTSQFIGPDTLIPELYHPMALNRYSYVLGNPMALIDPTGHAYCGIDGLCNQGIDWQEQGEASYLGAYGVILDGSWSSDQTGSAKQAIRATAKKLATWASGNAAEVFRGVFNRYGRSLVLAWKDAISNYTSSPQCEGVDIGACTVGGAQIRGTDEYVWLITFASINEFDYSHPENNELRRQNNIVHEFGHLFNSVAENFPYIDVSSEWGLLKRGSNLEESYGFASPLKERIWIQNKANVYYEVFADQFLGWVFNQWEPGRYGTSSKGVQRGLWMNVHMPLYLQGILGG
jgi:RHS repeat-associated protein